MEQIRIGKTLVDYHLVYSSRQKTIELVIDLDSGFTVKAPAGISKEDVAVNLQRKASWIITNLDKMNEVIRNETRKEFVSGEKFLYKGKHYRLKVIQVNEQIVSSLAFTHSKFIAHVPANLPEFDYPRIIQPLFIDFYHEKAEKILNQRARKYLVYFEAKPSLIKVQSLKNKWGNCSKTNQLRFNWRVVMAKMSVIDYVVVHELCHTKHKDHSRAFWNEVQKILPDYEGRKEWLRINGDLLKI
ncbi:SprT family zinc-dependent metalloprotease [Methanosarcina sp. Z-7115]|uniref:SprT family zinc-dependent metalloprotease n=1 Tax=Methanosarcina baikalica TaxID=3073890 RepID=A0ABU2D476_9EURY|nr:SprT family zinc-dependent metalloprotease [Methanosarcina sp. Z-7115]MDR7666772.1 SprT family zinc-dependent metalloprotease [Methanosarcina sp. Z-7115]